MAPDPSAEEKIKEAARIIFMQKGYAATKTRDIAEKAGINLALVNYYFRSKENLFQQIMMESLAGFFESIKSVFFDTETNLEEKLSRLASGYIDQIKRQPDTPMFILSELRSRPDQFIDRVSGQVKFKDSAMSRQIVEAIGKERLSELNPVHILMNLMSMIVFPFVARPILERVGEVGEEQFDRLMEDRKKLIPQWIIQMLK